MYIVSKFHDYYDSAAVYGIDKSIVYKRDTQIIDIKYTNSEIQRFEDSINFKMNFMPSLYTSMYCTKVLVSFCGKCYIGAKIGSVKKINEDEQKYHWMNFLDDKIHQLIENKEIYTDKNYYDITHHRYSNSRNDYSAITQNIRLIELHVKYNSPIILCKSHTYDRKYSIIVNPSLNEYNFYQMLDAPTAFQEIQNYISGVLGIIEKDTVQVSEKDKLLQHGMDPKWSFRNPNPPKRKSKK